MTLRSTSVLTTVFLIYIKEVMRNSNHPRYVDVEDGAEGRGKGGGREGKRGEGKGRGERERGEEEEDTHD